MGNSDMVDDWAFNANFSADGVVRLKERVMDKLKEFMGEYSDETLAVPNFDRFSWSTASSKLYVPPSSLPLKIPACKNHCLHHYHTQSYMCNIRISLDPPQRRQTCRQMNTSSPPYSCYTFLQHKPMPIYLCFLQFSSEYFMDPKAGTWKNENPEKACIEVIWKPS